MSEITSRIASVVIGPTPVRITDSMPEVTATFEDGTVKALFAFFPDELSFREDEFVGLTEAEALCLKSDKDLSYLRD